MPCAFFLSAGMNVRRDTQEIAQSAGSIQDWRPRNLDQWRQNAHWNDSRSLERENGEREATVDVDQIKTAGGVPIGRIEIVGVSKLSRIQDLQ